jgi:adenylate cyclase, class 2
MRQKPTTGTASGGEYLRGVESPRRNLELKARNRDLARSLRTCEAIGARDEGTLRQIDTYFAVPRGRLKLREQPPRSEAQLIAYERPDVPGRKESRYRIVPTGDADGLRAALTAVLGVRVVVSKVRRLFIFEGVRIHLDRVDELGDFIEFEGVETADSDLAGFEPILAELCGSFEIADGDRLSTSYSDLLEEAKRP